MQEAGVDINQYGEVLRFAARIWEKEVQSAYI
jgi:hypothetical protein